MKQPCEGLALYRTPEGHAFFRLHYSADPDITPEMLAKYRLTYTTEAYWRREMEIEAGALRGQPVFPEFNPAIHVVKDSDIPLVGCCYMGIDPHPRTPHAMLWVLVDNWDDWYVYREQWPSKMYGIHGKTRDDEQENEFTTKEYAETVALLEGNELEWFHAGTGKEHAKYRHRDPNKAPEKVIERWMDQAGKGFKVSAEGQEVETYATRYAKYGINCGDPVKAHQTGEDAIRDLLKARRHEIRGNWPKLHISDQCPELIMELKNHRFRTTKTLTEERDLKQETSEFRCHMVDLLRYIATSDARYRSRRVSKRFTKRQLTEILRRK